MASSHETSAQTLSLLEERLKRIDFLVNGSRVQDEDSAAGAVKGSAAVRLHNLDRALSALSTKSHAVSSILVLQKQHPDLFNPSPTSSALPPSALASLVLAHSNLYQSLSSRLPQLQDTPIPDSSAAAKLIDLRPRIENVRAKQNAQMKEVAELRTRSAKAAEEWYEGGVLGMDERWAEWEERLRDVEILVRRREAAKKREDGAV